MTFRSLMYMGKVVENAECLSLQTCELCDQESVSLAHINAFSLLTDKNSPSSSPMDKTISVPRPRVFPRGSGKISNESPEEEETKVYCCGSGFDDVAGGSEETWTVGETKKLHNVSWEGNSSGELTRSKSRDLVSMSPPFPGISERRTKLANEIPISPTAALLSPLKKLARPTPSDGAQIPSQLVFRHTYSGV